MVINNKWILVCVWKVLLFKYLRIYREVNCLLGEPEKGRFHECISLWQGREGQEKGTPAVS